MVRISSHIPDTLYMIDDHHQHHHGQPYGTHQASCYLQSSGGPRPGSPVGLMLPTADLDVVTGAVPGILILHLICLNSNQVFIE